MLIILHGADQFRSFERLHFLREAFEKKYSDSSTVTVFDFDWQNPKERFLDSLALEGGLFSSKKMVVAKRLFSKWAESSQGELKDFFKREGKRLFDDKENIVVFWEDSAIESKNKLLKYLKQKVKVEEFKVLSENEIIKWIKRKADLINPQVKVSNDIARKIATYCGDDLFLLDNTVKKLLSFKNTGELKEDDVDELVVAKASANIFETIDSFCCDKSKALLSLHSHIKKGDDPFYLFSMIVYQFRNLIQVSYFSQKGLSEREIASATKLHPFVVKKSLAISGNYTFSRLKKIYQKMADIDGNVKVGKVDIILALDKMAIEL